MSFKGEWLRKQWRTEVWLSGSVHEILGLGPHTKNKNEKEEKEKGLSIPSIITKALKGQFQGVVQQNNSNTKTVITKRLVVQLFI